MLFFLHLSEDIDLSVFQSLILLALAAMLVGNGGWVGRVLCLALLWSAS